METGDTVIPASLHDPLVARLDRLPGVKEIAQTAGGVKELSWEEVDYLAPGRGQRATRNRVIAYDHHGGRLAIR